MMTLHPWKPEPNKLTTMGRIDRVRGVLEMMAKHLIWDREYADYAAALELAHEELQRIREEIDLAVANDIDQPEVSQGRERT
jgi:hypothetical protein